MRGFILFAPCIILLGWWDREGRVGQASERSYFSSILIMMIVMKSQAAVRQIGNSMALEHGHEFTRSKIKLIQLVLSQQKRVTHSFSCSVPCEEWDWLVVLYNSCFPSILSVTRVNWRQCEWRLMTLHRVIITSHIVGSTGRRRHCNIIMKCNGFKMSVRPSVASS